MRLVRRLPLVWKILVPFLVLLLALGMLGGFVIVRDLSERAERAVDEELLRRSLELQSSLGARELSLLESANFAANLEGMAEAVASGDAAAAGELLRSVLALKRDLELVAATDAAGTVVAALAREPGLPEPVSLPGTGPEAAALAATAATGERVAAVVDGPAGGSLAAVASPVCTAAATCEPVGGALVGSGVQLLVSTVATGAAPARVALYDEDGRTLAAAGDPAPPEPPAGTFAAVRERSQRVTEGGTASLYSAYILQGRPAGIVGVSVDTAPAFDAARRAATRLGVILLAALLGVTLLGALLSRYLVERIRVLLETNRRLGAGDLGARVPVDDEDELGELAAGFNHMADQLEDSYTTLESRVAERTEEVRRLLDERTEFFTALSHQLRTPLGVILAEADMLGNDDARSTIKQSASQLVSVVNDILRIAEAESGTMEVQLEELDLRKVVSEVRPTLDGISRAADVRATIRLPRSLPPIVADRDRLREVLVNLVDNAAKYTPAGGRITVSAAVCDRAVAVAVSDTGVGIPAEVGDRVFDPFYRVKGTVPQRSQPSTGLGLAVTRRLVEAQGGTISYRSGQHRGTTFVFTVPCAAPVAAPADR